MRRKWTIGGAALALLAGCGGGGSETGSVSAPAPAPTPAPTPTPTGSVARVVAGDVPGLAPGDVIGNFQTTNQGLYFTIGRSNRILEVGKLHGNPAEATDWSIVARNDNVDYLAFAPANIYTEAARAVNFYYIGLRQSDATYFFGYRSSGGTTSYRTGSKNPGEKIFGIAYLAAGNTTGTFASRPWIATPTIDAGSLDLYQDDGQYSNDGTIADRFSKPAQPVLTGGLYIEKMLSHPTDPMLYVAYDNRILVYSSEKLVKSFSFSQKSHVSDMVWYEGDLYVAHGTGIYRVAANGTTSLVTTLPTANLPTANLDAAATLPGRFCINGGTMFLVSGEAIRLGTGTRRDWISSGTLSATQTTGATALKASLNAGIYCSAQAPSPVIWTPRPTAQPGLRAITPLAG